MLRPGSPQPHRGFTLIELLVSLVILSLIALLSWRGLDAMARARERTQTHSTALSRLGHALAQWQDDLDALETTGEEPALLFDGLSLRLTRRDADPQSGAMRVVAWSLRTATGTGQTKWVRWMSPALRTAQDVQQAWASAQVWANTPSTAAGDLEVALTEATHWQLFYFRNDAWANPQSSAGAQTQALPDGVRLEIDLSMPDGLQGRIRRDWVRPVLGGNKS